MSLKNHRLRNLVSRKVARDRMSHDDVARKTVSFYRYVVIENPHDLRDRLFKEWSELGVLGRIYLAKEGINAQISVPEANWDDFVAHLNGYETFKDMPFKIALEENLSFIKLTIKVKHQIVADGLTPEDYDINNIGTHLKPEDFHAMMDDPDSVVVDMRNHYESEIGHFEGAILPNVDTFREELPEVRRLLADKKDKKVMLYCTGGIRCEKASAYLKHHGFDQVYQLNGGIINYAHEMEKKRLPSKFKGKNFVFDERRAERVTEDILSECHQCGKACDEHTNCKNELCNLLFIQCEGCAQQFDGCCGNDCAKIAALPDDERREYRRKNSKKHGFDEYRKSLRPEERIKA